MATGFAASPPTRRPVTDDLTEAEWLIAIWIAAGLTAAALEDFPGADELLALAGFPFAGGMELVPRDLWNQSRRSTGS